MVVNGVFVEHNENAQYGHETHHQQITSVTNALPSTPRRTTVAEEKDGSYIFKSGFVSVNEGGRIHLIFLESLYTFMAEE